MPSTTSEAIIWSWAMLSCVYLGNQKKECCGSISSQLMLKITTKAVLHIWTVSHEFFHYIEKKQRFIFICIFPLSLHWLFTWSCITTKFYHSCSILEIKKISNVQQLLLKCNVVMLLNFTLHWNEYTSLDNIRKLCIFFLDIFSWIRFVMLLKANIFLMEDLVMCT